MVGYSNEKHHSLVHSKTTLVLYNLEKESEIPRKSADTITDMVSESEVIRISISEGLGD